MCEPVASPCTVFHCVALDSPKPFLNFPLWSCPALCHAQWRPQQSSQSPGAQEEEEEDPMSLTAAVNAVPVNSPEDIHTSHCKEQHRSSRDLIFFSLSLSLLAALCHSSALLQWIQQQPNAKLVGLKIRPYSIQTFQSSYGVISKEISCYIYTFLSFIFLSVSPIALVAPGTQVRLVRLNISLNT